jgi:NADP-dependent 3-hydroxy acid dehydrogenase YdfG
LDGILNSKTAVVYGAGSIGGAVAAAFAKAGATVFVADHHAETLQKLADTVGEDRIQTALVDVLDQQAVAAFVTSVVERTGHVDISFCATSTHKPGGEQGAALTEIRFDDFAMPILDYTKATFNTATAVYPYMVKQHSGVIMGMTAVVSHMPLPYTAGFGPAWAAVEALLRVLAAELGPHGVRTVCLQSAGSDGAADKTLAMGPTLDEPQSTGPRPHVGRSGAHGGLYGLRSCGRDDGNDGQPGCWHDQSLERSLSLLLSQTVSQECGNR